MPELFAYWDGDMIRSPEDDKQIILLEDEYRKKFFKKSFT